MATTTYENNVEYAPFNSIDGDRAINANHLARWLSSVNSDGVSRQFNEFETTIATGMNVIVDTGIGHVKGCHLYLKAPQTITIQASNSSGDRIDTIGFRLQVAERKVLLYYSTGEVGTGEAPTPIKDTNTYVEIPLYNIKVRSGATSLIESDILDVREYVVSSATFFKKYTQTLSTASTISSLTISTPFNVETDDVEIFVNGIALLSGQYSIEDNVITFNTLIPSGNNIQINVWHFQDGSGTMDSLNEIQARIDEVEKTTRYYYYCNGQNDNIILSEIAQNYLVGTSNLNAINVNARNFLNRIESDIRLNTNAQIEIIVCGNCGVSTYYSGTGTQTDPYKYFAFGRPSTSSRTIYFNFSNCSRITVNCPTTTDAYATIFSGADINIRNVALNVAAGYNVDIINGTNVHCVDSEFWMTTTNNCCVGRCCGVFENIRTSITSTSGNAYCFYSNGNLTRIIGGTHYAWTASSAGVAVCFYVIDAAANNENVLFITMTNCPQNTRSGYTQTDTIQVNRGYCTAIMNTLWKAATFGTNSETTIAYGNVILSKN